MCETPKNENQIVRFSQVADAVRDILETQEHENATLSQTQFKLLDELMKEVNRLIGVHCSETADMVRRYNVNPKKPTRRYFFPL